MGEGRVPGALGNREPTLLERVDLTLALLNEATQAWVEQDYNAHRHSETGETPIARYLAGPSVARDCPDSGTLRRAFTRSDRAARQLAMSRT